MSNRALISFWANKNDKQLRQAMEGEMQRWQKRHLQEMEKLQKESLAEMAKQFQSGKRQGGFYQ